MAEGNQSITTTTTATPTTRLSFGPTRLLTSRIVQNFLLIWLDANIDEINDVDSRTTITKLRQVVNAIYTFTDVDECIEYITGIETEKVFVIVSGSLGERVVPLIHDIPQLVSVYILCANEAQCESWIRQWLKIQGIFTHIEPICEVLKGATRDCDHNSVSMRFAQTADIVANRDLDQLDPSFMYTQILKDILLEINFEMKHFNEFLTYCREQFVGNNSELDNIDKIQMEYHDHSPIWWYTHPCFLYSMLNRALRLTDVDLIIKMGFFLRDLHNHIAQVHADQYEKNNYSGSLTVFVVKVFLVLNLICCVKV